jgi:hypothetical protein
MVVVMVTTSTLVAAAAPVMVVGEGSARPCEQERGSGHNGQNQRLTKHQ